MTIKCVSYNQGSELCWFKNNVLHKEDGPAVIGEDGFEEWFFEGENHREDGPAVTKSNGEKLWYIKGKQLSEDDFIKWQIENNKHPLSIINKSINNKKIKV